MKSHFVVSVLLLSAMSVLAPPVFAAPGMVPGWLISTGDSSRYEFGSAPTEGANGKAAYIRAKEGATASGSFNLGQCIDGHSYEGTRLRFTGRMKTIAASSGRFWLRADKGDLALNGAITASRTGTAGWQSGEIVIDVPKKSDRLCYGVLLRGGKGEVWADDLQIDRVNRTVPLTNNGQSEMMQYSSHGGLGRMDDR